MARINTDTNHPGPVHNPRHVSRSNIFKATMPCGGAGEGGATAAVLASQNFRGLCPSSAQVTGDVLPPQMVHPPRHKLPVLSVWCYLHSVAFHDVVKSGGGKASRPGRP